MIEWKKYDEEAIKSMVEGEEYLIFYRQKLKEDRFYVEVEEFHNRECGYAKCGSTYEPYFKKGFDTDVYAEVLFYAEISLPEGVR